VGLIGKKLNADKCIEKTKLKNINFISYKKIISEKNKNIFEGVFFSSKKTIRNNCH
jgi:hypothetical protein